MSTVRTADQPYGTRLFAAIGLTVTVGGTTYFRGDATAHPASPRPGEAPAVMSYLILIVSVLAYATGIVAQSYAARQTEQRSGVDPGLLVRLASQKVYLLGFGAQVVGFGLAFLARADLPLFLVQAASTSAVGVATLIGVLVLGWRPRPVELGILVV